MGRIIFGMSGLHYLRNPLFLPVLILWWLVNRFEAFDEPWKVIYNTPGKSWEDKWGLMDAGRNLKAGLTIPDCGGKTAT